MNKLGDRVEKKSFTIINKKTHTPLPPPPIEEKKFIIENLPDTNVKNELMSYYTLSVETTGDYIVSHQLCLKCVNTTTIHNLQFGLCHDDYSDQSDLFHSSILNVECEENHILSNNLTSIKHFEKDTKYILWCNVDTADDNTFCIVGDFSKLQLFKL